MEILVNKKIILANFLEPISRFSDQVIINFHADYMDCISYMTDDKQSIILYSRLKLSHNDEIKEPLKLNVGSLRKLIQAFRCIPDEIIKLNVSDKVISYKSDATQFRFHLKEDGVIEKPVFNLEKIEKIQFDLKFDITFTNIQEILRAGSFCSESNKIYIYADDARNIVADITDKTIQNVDKMSIQICDSYIGEKLDHDTILKIDIFKLLAALKQKCSVSINKDGVVLFEIADEWCVIKYITTSLIK